MTAIQRNTQAKLDRLRHGGKPRVLDLFAGCGGLSLGFDAAGFNIAAAVEHDDLAAQSHSRNFHDGDGKHAKARDITSLTPTELASELGLGPIGSAIDVIVGGPPCQAFARVGRPKLREVAEHPRAFERDPRAGLYLHYLKYVEAFQPLALLMENVPDVLNHGGQNIAEEICDVLEDKGYLARYTLLNAAFYGVPQMRERMFLIAYRKDVASEVIFPTPTHWLELPVGYNGSRQVALRFMKHPLLGDDWRYIDPPSRGAKFKPAVTAEQAIGDLPPITLHLEGKLRRGARRFDERIAYSSVRPSSYARLMKAWPGHEGNGGVHDHVIRYLPRDWNVFARMNNGDQYPEAYLHAVDMFEERLRELGRKAPKPGTVGHKKLKAEIVPPYDVDKFPNKWRKMWRDQPARTLMAHLGKDTYSHIHYDSKQARTISVREAARLQSFPDGFTFCGTMNPAFRQIGNAVPPLMAKALAERIYATLFKSVEKTDGEYEALAEARAAAL
jgi:DNA (cytosine-5)-methyltransferase 1